MEENKVQEQLPIVPAVENVDNKVLANAVNEKLEYSFAKHFLVKQLDAKKVLKTLTKPEPTGEKDDDGDDIMEMVSREVEVDSYYREGVILDIPESYKQMPEKTFNLEIGDVIVYSERSAVPFDLFKDSVAIELYNIIGKRK